MNSHAIDRIRQGWRAIVLGALIGAVLFGAYSVLSRSAGAYSMILTYQLSDPRAAMAELDLDVDLGVEDTAEGVADLVQSTAADAYDLDDVRVVARGVDGSRMVAVTITGSESDVTTATVKFKQEFPRDRAEQLAGTAARAVESLEDKRQKLTEEVELLDVQIDSMNPESDDVFRERLLLDRLETTREILDSDRQIGDLQRLSEQDPAVTTRLVTERETFVGTSPFTGVPLGLVFGALIGVIVVLTRSDRRSSPDAAPAATGA